MTVRSIGEYEHRVGTDADYKIGRVPFGARRMEDVT